MAFKVSEHVLVPEHKKLTKEERATLLDKYHVTIKELPKILDTDAAIAHLNVSSGDIIHITRKSQTAGTAVYYRVVVSG
jgi:DNA-directed RNA polymerase subunit H